MRSRKRSLANSPMTHEVRVMIPGRDVIRLSACSHKSATYCARSARRDHRGASVVIVKFVRPLPALVTPSPLKTKFAPPHRWSRGRAPGGAS